jgi:hypothetical protein
VYLSYTAINIVIEGDTRSVMIPDDLYREWKKVNEDFARVHEKVHELYLQSEKLKENFNCFDSFGS